MTRPVKQDENRGKEPANLKLEETRMRREAKPFFNAWRLGFLGILILAAIAYFPSLHGMRVWDDNGLLDGTSIGGGTSFWNALTKPFLGAYFRPLVSVSFFIENKLWHGTPFLYHQTNILLHVFACAALMGFVLAAFGKRSLALVSGLLFAVQPAQVSTVAWIGGRTDSLCSLLVVLFSYFLLLAVRSAGSKRVLWLSLSVVAFFLAAVTKEQVAALILLVPFAAKAFAPEAKKPDFKVYARLTLPYVIAAGVFVVLWFAFNPNPFHAVGRGFLGQLMTAGKTTVYYSLLFLAPSSKWMHSLSLGTMDRAGLGLSCAGIVLLGLFMAGTVICIRRNPKLGWFAGFVALAMLPVSNLVPLPSLLVAPYRAGVAGLGVAVLMAWVLTNLPFKQLAYGIGALFVCWCTWMTYWGSTQWMDPVTVFSRFTSEDPTSIVARRNMTGYLMVNGKFKEAAAQMEGILTSLYGSTAWKDPDTAFDQFQNDPELNRRVIENQGNEVEAKEWLGELFAQYGFAISADDPRAYERSRSAFESAVRINPKSAGGHVGLSQIAVFEKKYDLAVRHLRIAIAVHPSDPHLYVQLGDAYLLQGKLSLAATSYKQTIAIEHWSAFSYQRLAEVQVRQGNVSGAIETLKSALNCQVLDEEGIKARIGQLESRQKQGGS